MILFLLLFFWFSSILFLISSSAATMTTIPPYLQTDLSPLVVFSSSLVDQSGPIHAGRLMEFVQLRADLGEHKGLPALQSFCLAYPFSSSFT